MKKKTKTPAVQGRSSAIDFFLFESNFILIRTNSANTRVKCLTCFEKKKIWECASQRNKES